jgi:hypothetical protein
MQNRYETVLVGVLKAPRDLAFALAGWYRIPVERLPSRARQARYIAFYQPRSFGGEGGVVRYFAPIVSWGIALRRELLPEEAAHPRAEAPYYRLGLGPLERLEPPIACGRWRRFAFILTHLGRLYEARELRDLVHGNRWEESLWKALRHAGLLG